MTTRTRLLGCVANFSEGRDGSSIQRIVSAASGFSHVWTVDLHTDPDHHRSVMTVIGEPEGLVEAMLAVTAEAKELIDLRRHDGAHPRTGAMDVVPFVPLSGSSMDQAVRSAHRFAERAASRLGIPSFFYEHASGPGEGLPSVRRHASEGATPDVGPAPDVRAGVMCVGARPVLVAYNVVLDTDSQKIAKQVAKIVRSSDGGLPHVRALGLMLASKGLAQVSMNLTDPTTTGLRKAFTAVSAAASDLGTEVLEAEVVGLATRDSLEGASAIELGLAEAPKLLEDAVEQVLAREAGQPSSPKKQRPNT